MLTYVITLPVVSRETFVVIKLITISRALENKDFCTLTEKNQYCVWIRLGCTFL